MDREKWKKVIGQKNCRGPGERRKELRQKLYSFDLEAAPL
jgi:hypothetical protein